MLNEIHNESDHSDEALNIDPAILDLKRLQMFYLAVKAGTFSAAAQSLNISPSAVSHALKGLEEDVGCALFKRTGPHVSPTATAIRLLPIVEDVLFKMATIRSEIAKIDGREETLIIGVCTSAKMVLTPTAMSAFCECFPNANVEIVPLSHMMDGSRAHNLDFEIGETESAPRDAVRRVLVKEVLRVYAAPFHLLGMNGKVSSAQIRQSVLVFPDKRSADLIASEFSQDTKRSLKRWIMPDSYAARDLALQGQCLAFLPESIAAPSIANGELNLLRTNAAPLQRSFSAWWNPGRPLPWIAEVFLSLLVVNGDNENSAQA
jgi:DNA-binding transcriptional LysR family regulator